MSLHNRVTENPTICGLELAFNGHLEPSPIVGFQPFVNSFMRSTDFEPTNFGLGSVTFSEESDVKQAGVYWKQTLTIRLAATDASRATRLAMMTKVKFLKLKLSNGLDLVMGRNDFNQNTKPKIAIKTNIKLAEIEFTTFSIIPAGFVLNPNIISNQQIPLMIYVTQ